MATSNATMRSGASAFKLLYGNYVRRLAISGNINLRNSEIFHLLPEASPSIDSISVKDLKLINFPFNAQQLLVGKPFLGQSRVEARRASSDEDVDVDEDMDDFDDGDFDDSCDDDDFDATCSDEDGDEDKSVRRKIR